MMARSDEEQVIEEFNARLSKQSRLKTGLVNILRKGKIVHRTLLLSTVEPLPRATLGGFWDELGAMHGAVLAARPDVDVVTIEDTAGTGQRISVTMKDLIAYSEKRLTRVEFLARWKIERGKEKQGEG